MKIKLPSDEPVVIGGKTEAAIISFACFCLLMIVIIAAGLGLFERFTQ